MLIGVIGKIGSGKSHAAFYLAKELKYKYVSVDKIIDNLYEINKLRDKIYEKFDVTNRHELAEKVFKNSKKLQELENILFPFLEVELENKIHENIIIDCAILPKLKVIKKLDKILVISAYDNVIIERVKKRDDRNIEQINNILNSQNNLIIGDNSYNIIENNETMIDFEKKLDKYIKSYFNNYQN